MNVTVCVKRVLSTSARVKIAGDGLSIDEGGAEFVLNPYDEIAVEEAIRQAETSGGEVTIVTLGSPAVSKELRTCLAMGAHKAVHLSDDGGLKDGLATATALAEVVRETEPDLVLFGRQAVDGDNAQVGLMVATLLGFPAVADVTKVEAGDGKVVVEREVEGGARQRYELSLPAVLTTQKSLNEPRLPNLKGIMAAKKKPVEDREVELGAATQRLTRLELPPERVAGKIVGKGPEAVGELLRLLREEAGAL